jgi:hypothetical protein
VASLLREYFCLLLLISDNKQLLGAQDKDELQNEACRRIRDDQRRNFN